jgi:ATP-binding cassette, subfamily B, bacterial PglK
MRKYISKVLYVLTGTRRSLIILLLMFIGTSILEAFGIGLLGPFFSLASQPESFKKMGFLNRVYDQLNLESSNQLVAILGLVIVVAFCVKSVSYFAVRTYIFRFGFQQKKLLTSRLLNAYLSVPYTFHLSRNSSHLIKNIIVETNQFTNGCLLPMLEATSNLVMMITLLLVLAKTDLLLLTMILGILLPTFVFFKKLGHRLKHWGQVKSKSQKSMISILNHSLGGLKETRVIGCEPYFQAQMDEQSERFAKAATRFQSSQLLPRISIETMLVIVVILFICGAQLFADQNAKDFTSIIATFAVASMRLIPASSQFIQGMGQLQNSSYALDMLYLDLQEISKPGDRRQLSPAKKFKGDRTDNGINNQAMAFSDRVELQNVTYSYPEVEEPALTDISLNIKKGESIALIGKSGAGKTTLVDVLLGLLEPQGGDICVDGVSIYENLRAWQNLVGYIPQSIFLTDDTIERNIAFGVDDRLIDSERLQKAIEAAQLQDLVAQLPKGIKTGVGERGVRLSGGQRQRIGIARALYHEREILVLDEATAALDNETERFVTEAMKALAGTKTLIIIAHRLSTIEHCDRVYVMEKGRVVKSGSYQEVVVEQSK